MPQPCCACSTRDQRFSVVAKGRAGDANAVGRASAVRNAWQWYAQVASTRSADGRNPSAYEVLLGNAAPVSGRTGRTPFRIKLRPSRPVRPLKGKHGGING